MDDPQHKFKLRTPVVVLGSSKATAIRKRNKAVNYVLLSIATTAIVSSLLITWYQTKALAALQFQHQQLGEKVTLGPPVKPPEPLKFISVVGPYHSGTKAMWQSIRNNEWIAAEKGIDLKAYATVNGGYPPCGVPLKSDSTIDMKAAMGNVTAGIAEPNSHLFARYGTLWGDWHAEGAYTQDGVLRMKPPHESEEFYTWWKHTPPQHPILACFRPDTLYVVMVRHPKVWRDSMKRMSYDLKFEPLLKLWRLVRSDPRRLPPMEMRFRSLYNTWEYYMRGYLSWELFSSGTNCFGDDPNRAKGSTNCLGGANKIPKDKRNIVIVRYEDYLMNPKRVLRQIFSFASRGLINASDEVKFNPLDVEKVKDMRGMLNNLKESNSFSAKEEDWEGATQLTVLCKLLGYSCDESPDMFIGQSKDKPSGAQAQNHKKVEREHRSKISD